MHAQIRPYKCIATKSSHRVTGLRLFLIELKNIHQHLRLNMVYRLQTHLNIFFESTKDPLGLALKSSGCSPE
jgi:hypothetical protein